MHGANKVLFEIVLTRLGSGFPMLFISIDGLPSSGCYIRLRGHFHLYEARLCKVPHILVFPGFQAKVANLSDSISNFGGIRGMKQKTFKPQVLHVVD